MTDVFSKKKRSQVMAAIRSKGNKTTELRLASILRAHGISGWRRHQPLFGKPDFVFRRERLAVFVDGCFWHGCPQALPNASRKPRILAAQNRWQSRPRPPHNPTSSQAEVAGSPHLGPRARLYGNRGSPHHFCVGHGSKNVPSSTQIKMNARDRTFAEFFNSIGMMHIGLENAGCDVK